MNNIKVFGWNLMISQWKLKILIFLIYFFNIDISLNILTKIFEILYVFSSWLSGGQCVSDFLYRSYFLFYEI